MISFCNMKIISQEKVWWLPLNGINEPWELRQVVMDLWLKKDDMERLMRRHFAPCCESLVRAPWGNHNDCHDYDAGKRDWKLAVMGINLFSLLLDNTGLIGPPLSTISQIKDCGGVENGFGGIIKSPNYPNAFPKKIDCMWLIRVDQDQHIYLRIMQLQLFGSIGKFNTLHSAKSLGLCYGTLP